MPEQGYLIIADITGYTAFLSESELEHADDSLATLLNALIEQIKEPLVISRVEGDAVFAYASDSALLQGQTMLEAIESAYYAFATTRDRMNFNTTCTCTACTLIPKLDLKFITHHGTYVLQKLGQFTELAGNDVNLVHRLGKNHIPEQTGISAYAFFTEAAIEALKVGEFARTMVPHTETYEHLGDVKGYVYDLRPRWERAREQERIYVDLDEAWFSFSAKLPVPPALLWDYLHEPEFKRQWIEADSMELSDLDNGRVDVGTTYHCAHGDTMLNQYYVDWRPFEYATYDLAVSPTDVVRCTTRLTQTKGGTRLDYFIAKVDESGEIQDMPADPSAVNDEIRQVEAIISNAVLNIRQLIAGELAEGRIPTEASPAKKAVQEEESAT